MIPVSYFVLHAEFEDACPRRRDAERAVPIRCGRTVWSGNQPRAETRSAVSDGDSLSRRALELGLEQAGVGLV